MQVQVFNFMNLFPISQVCISQLCFTIIALLFYEPSIIQLIPILLSLYGWMIEVVVYEM